MSTQRFNKHGIPILDPPGVNHARRQQCLPDEHDYKTEYKDKNHSLFKCTRCGMVERVDKSEH